ncbi:hypothetical protein L2449_09350 [Mesorhizobium muleiense]|uniref:hypothetical protein n=1 Tax=Mesorhizobium muleiense TaxID=1004279 RepID=UPI001F3CD75A|nr:hypothetical protein [Mesorhizobium muleiense]MCF6117118.1 hypothetical protein [Mesorhizobium muleiense]
MMRDSGPHPAPSREPKAASVRWKGKGQFLLDRPKVSRIRSAGKMLAGDLPRIVAGRSFLADPMEAVGRDLGETSPRFEAARILADLDNVLTLGSSNLARAVLVERVVSDDVPAPMSGSKIRKVMPYMVDGAGRLGLIQIS